MKKCLILFASLLLLGACSKGADETSNGSLRASAQTLTFEADDVTPRTVTITAENTDWTFSVSEDWVTANREDNILNISVSQNTDTNARQAIISIDPSNSSLLSVTIVVKQSGFSEAEPALAISSNELNFAATGNSAQEITVTAEGGVQWDITILDQFNWIKASKNGNILSINVEDNPVSISRSGTITVLNTNEALGNTVKPVMINISQEALEVEASMTIRNLPEDNTIRYTHYEDGTFKRNISSEGLIVELEPQSATWTVETVSGEEWFNAYGTGKHGEAMLFGPLRDNVPAGEAEAEFIVRHENPNVAPITIKVHKDPVIYFDYSSTLAEDRDTDMTKAFGRLTTYLKSYYTGYSRIDLAFYTEDVDYNLDGWSNPENFQEYFYYKGKGEIVIVTLYDIDVTTEISSRTFELSESKEVGVAVPGTVSQHGGRYQLSDCSYAQIDNNIKEDVAFAVLKNGTVTVEKNGEEYTIEWNMTSDNGHTVSGRYVGTIDFEYRELGRFDFGGDSGDLDNPGIK